MNWEKTCEENKKLQNRKKLRITMIVLIIITVIAVWVGTTAYSLSRFESGTYINGVDCSELTPSEVAQKVEESIQNDITFTVISITDDGKLSTKSYNATSKDFEVHVANVKNLETALSDQKSKLTWKDILLLAPNWVKGKIVPNNSMQEISVENLIDINTSKLRAYLEKIPEFQEESIREAKDAYIAIVDNQLKIIPEEKGYIVDLSEAVAYATQCILVNNTNIDFSSIIQIPPVVTAEDIEAQSNIALINKALSTIIDFKFIDGTEMKLDASIMKDWVEESEEGKWNYKINLEDNLPAFLDLVESKLNKLNNHVTFMAGDEEVTVYVEEKFRPKFDSEIYYEKIETDLFTESGMITYGPNYESRDGLSGSISTYIALDIENQTVWAYEEGNQILKALCVTGDVAHGDDTPTGIYYLIYKTKNATLRGYNYDGSRYASFVNFWMPFNGGIGFHDAPWRSGAYGGEVYKTNGSHGCVNMLYEDAEVLYNFINSSIPIIVY